MRILGFASVSEAGVFDSYRQNKDQAPFRRVNVIYGPNGSGKSTFARIFQKASTGSNEKGTTVFEVSEPAEGASKKLSNLDSHANVFVFSDDFVDRNHRFNEGTPTLEAILTLGEKSIDLEAQFDAAIKQQTQLVADIEEARAQVASLEREQAATLTRVSTSVVDHLSRVSIYRSRGHYSSGTVKARFSGDRAQWVILDQQVLAEKLQIVQSENKDAIDLDALSVQVPKILEPIKELLDSNPVSSLLDSLILRPEASEWVDSGRKFHVAAEHCLYCGGTLTSERRASIEAHFNDLVKQVQFEIDSRREEVNRIIVQCQSAISALPDHRLTFEDLQPRYRATGKIYTDSLSELMNWLHDITDALIAKRANTLTVLDTDIRQQPVLRFEQFAEVIEAHNIRVSTYAETISVTAGAIEQHLLASEVGGYDSVSLKLVSQQELLAALMKKLSDLNDLMSTLNAVEGDPLPSAENLTTEVAKLLGRDELKFIAIDDKYEVYRHGQAAVYLSRGERTAIALAHFLESVVNADASLGLPIVVVDDPVSSLDANVFMGVSSRLWNLALSTKIDQFFLLTHNFDLFRQWDLQLAQLNKKSELFSHLMLELKVAHKQVEGRPIRRAELVEWPETPIVRDKVRSTYHHNFILLVGAYQQLRVNDTIETRLDAMALMPNVIRRVLETFLAFKRPGSVGQFSEAMRGMDALLIENGYMGDATALRQTLSRFSNAYSHDESPETDVNVNSEEIKAALLSLFTFMHQLDREHFIGLCSILHLNATDLILEDAERKDQESQTNSV